LRRQTVAILRLLYLMPVQKHSIPIYNCRELLPNGGKHPSKGGVSDK
jgi:hypothetical protein